MGWQWHQLDHTQIICTMMMRCWQGCSLEPLVLVSRHLEDMKNGLGLEISLGLDLVLAEKVLILVLTKKSQHFQDLDE